MVILLLLIDSMESTFNGANCSLSSSNELHPHKASTMKDLHLRGPRLRLAVLDHGLIKSFDAI